MHHISPEFSVPVKFCLFNIAWTWIASVLTGNVSQVDRVWTFLPTVYTAYFAIYPLLHWADAAIKSQGVSQRAILVLVLEVSARLYLFSRDYLQRTKVIWMVRLSYNTWRRGLFSL